jgi:hypothetical protein
MGFNSVARWVMSFKREKAQISRVRDRGKQYPRPVYMTNLRKISLTVLKSYMTRQKMAKDPIQL